MLNQYCVYIYNNHRMKEYSSDPRIGRKVLSFQIKDKIMCTRNANVEVRKWSGADNPVKPLDFEDGSNWDLNTQRLMNGMVFQIMQVCLRFKFA